MIVMNLGSIKTIYQRRKYNFRKLFKKRIKSQSIIFLPGRVRLIPSLQSVVVIGIRNPRRGIQNPRLSWTPLHGSENVDSVFRLYQLLP